MSKAEPTIQKYMTTTPISIEAKESMASAASLMEKQRIRHLPVTNKGELVGIFTTVDACRALHDILKMRTHA